MTLTIYIALFNEGTNVWRPVEAEVIAADQYRIPSSRPADEDCPFAQNDIVQCGRTGGECLVSTN